MGKYRVVVCYTEIWEVEVEANSEEEAEQKGQETVWDDGREIDGFTNEVEVYPVEEEETSL